MKSYDFVYCVRLFVIVFFFCSELAVTAIDEKLPLQYIVEQTRFTFH